MRHEDRVNSDVALTCKHAACKQLGVHQQKQDHNGRASDMERHRRLILVVILATKDIGMIDTYLSAMQSELA